jgi:proline dehydrogenase
MEMLISKTQENPNLKITFATHNQESIEYGLKMLKNPNNSSIQFAQINGLGDHLSMNLVQNEIKVLKLLPCGTVEDVLPWLSR